MLNGKNAPFDSFIYLETTTNQRLFLALQMKLAYLDSGIRQQVTDTMIEEEYTKINGAVFKSLKGTDFVAVIIGACEGTFDKEKLPSKCVVIAEAEHDLFYGPFWYRINRILE